MLHVLQRLSAFQKLRIGNLNTRITVPSSLSFHNLIEFESYGTASASLPGASALNRENAFQVPFSSAVFQMQGRAEIKTADQSVYLSKVLSWVSTLLRNLDRAAETLDAVALAAT